jgi:hypothetical protein
MDRTELKIPLRSSQTRAVLKDGDFRASLVAHEYFIPNKMVLVITNIACSDYLGRSSSRSPIFHPQLIWVPPVSEKGYIFSPHGRLPPLAALFYRNWPATAAAFSHPPVTSFSPLPDAAPPSCGGSSLQTQAPPSVGSSPRTRPPWWASSSPPRLPPPPMAPPQ